MGLAGDVAVVAVAYLLGSISFGIVVSRLRGRDVRSLDLPGGSGVFRQVGPAWGLLVALLDLLKGIGAALLAASFGSPAALPFAGLAVVAGHVWPLYFGFRGGGGLATSTGFFLISFPAPTLLALAIGLLAVLLYYLLYWRRHPRSIFPFPIGGVVGFLALLGLLRDRPAGLATVGLVAALVAVRGLQLVLGRRR